MAAFHVRLGEIYQVSAQERLERDVPPVLLPRRHDERRLVVPRRYDRPHRVAEARARVQVDERCPSGPLGVPVCHPEGRSLLQTEYVPEVVREVPQKRQLCRARVAEDGRHPQLAQKIESSLADRAHNALPPIETLSPRQYIR